MYDYISNKTKPEVSERLSNLPEVTDGYQRLQITTKRIQIGLMPRFKFSPVHFIILTAFPNQRIVRLP